MELFLTPLFLSQSLHTPLAHTLFIYSLSYLFFKYAAGDHAKGFPGSSAGKESACNTGEPGLIPGLGRSPGGGPGNSLQYSCLENPHGQRSLEGYSPWVMKSQTQLGD